METSFAACSSAKDVREEKMDGEKEEMSKDKKNGEKEVRDGNRADRYL